MNKKLLKILDSIILVITCIFISVGYVSASSATISVTSSSSKVILGNTFNVYVKVSSSKAIGSWEWTIDYDTKKFKLQSGSSYIASYGDGKIKSKSYTYKFKAIGSGTGNITVKSYSVIEYSSETKMSVSKNTKSIKVIIQSELEASYSKNNNLSSLSVEGLTLSPTFSKDKTSYTVSAESNTQSINIIAKKEDSASSVSGTGKHDVAEGENKFLITVTAENGTTKTYTILVNVTDPNPIEVEINGSKYIVIKRESNLESPNNYNKTTVTINEQTVPAFKNEITGFTLVGLKDTDGNIKLYIYDAKSNTYTLYTEVQLNQMLLLPLKMDKTFDSAYKKSTTTIGEVEFESLKIDGSKHSIIHAKDLSSGEDNYYLYDEDTNTVIIYTDEEALPYKEKNILYERIIMILAGETCIILIVLISILIAKIRKNVSLNEF